MKGWRKNQDRRDAELASGANRLSRALEHVPESNDEPLFEPVGLNGSDENSKDGSDEDFVPSNDNIAETDPNNNDTLTQSQPMMSMELVCVTCGDESVMRNRQPRNQRPRNGPPKKRTRICRVVIDGMTCPNPRTCPGRSLKDNCILITKGDPNKRVSRVITKRTRRSCFICKRVDPECPGVRNRSKCTFGK